MSASFCLECNKEWTEFDAKSPPPYGEYLIWDADLHDPTTPKLWRYGFLRNHKGKFAAPGASAWYSTGGFVADRAPKYYMPLPKPPSIVNETPK